MSINVGDQISLPSGVSGTVYGVRVCSGATSVMVGSPDSDWLDASGAADANDVDAAANDPTPATAPPITASGASQ